MIKRQLLLSFIPIIHLWFELFNVGNKLFPPMNRKHETKWFKSEFLLKRSTRFIGLATSLIRIGILCYSTKYIIWRHFLTEHFVTSSVTLPTFKGGKDVKCALGMIMLNRLMNPCVRQKYHNSRALVKINCAFQIIFELCNCGNQIDLSSY